MTLSCHFAISPWFPTTQRMGRYGADITLFSQQSAVIMPARNPVGLEREGAPKNTCQDHGLTENRLWNLVQKLSSSDCQSSRLSYQQSLPPFFTSSSHLVQFPAALGHLVQIKVHLQLCEHEAIVALGEQSWSAGNYSAVSILSFFNTPYERFLFNLQHSQGFSLFQIVYSGLSSPRLPIWIFGCTALHAYSFVLVFFY